MGLRRAGNKHDWWTDLVRTNAELLDDLPRDAVASEVAFRDDVMRGVHRGIRFAPSVTELSAEALDKVWTFIHHRAQFEMNASLFDPFNAAYAGRGAQKTACAVGTGARLRADARDDEERDKVSA